MMNLKSFATNDETRMALEKLTIKELRVIADQEMLVGSKGWSKEKLIHNIVWFGRILPNTWEKIRNTPFKLYTGVTL